VCKSFYECFVCAKKDCTFQSTSREKRAEYMEKSRDKNLDEIREKDRKRKRDKYHRDKELRESLQKAGGLI
jgi:hypothetical protein